MAETDHLQLPNIMKEHYIFKDIEEEGDNNNN
jgi:hypothetical protein